MRLSRRDTDMLAVLALLFSGSVQALISPPWNLVLLHPVSWVPALRVFSAASGRRALMSGWLVGTTANLAIFYWLPGTMVFFGKLPFAAAVAVWLLFAAAMGFYTALFAWGLRRVRRAAGSAWPLAAAAWFCALEFLNPQIFGYLQGHAWYQVPQLFLICALTGVSGVSFLVIACNALILQRVELAGAAVPGALRAWYRNAAVLAVLLAAGAGYAAVRLQAIADAEAAAEPLLVAVVQPNHTVQRRIELARQGSDAFARDLLELSAQAAAVAPAGGSVDVYVWPEGALRTDPGRPANRSVLEFVRSSGAEVWTGANHQGDGVEHNSAFRIYADGRLDTRYDKNVLVPFGEYVPLRDVVPGFDRIHTVGDFERGTSVPVYASDPARFVFLICYEAIFPGFVRAAIGSTANLLVNVTVDAWYGDTSEQSQHLMLAAAQSALNGLPMIRATTTGISAVTDARGMLVAQAGNFTREVLVEEVRPLRVASPYSKLGEWFAWLCVLLSAMLLCRPQRPPQTHALE